MESQDAPISVAAPIMMTRPISVDPGLREVFQDIILDHDTRPRNFRRLQDSTNSVEAYNPLCGDRYTVYVRLMDDVLVEVAFHGFGCAISRASGSIMTTLLAGLPRPLARSLADSSVEYLTSGRWGDSRELGDLQALEGIYRIPSRQRCALLTWTALRSALAGEVR